MFLNTQGNNATMTKGEKTAVAAVHKAMQDMRKKLSGTAAAAVHDLFYCSTLVYCGSATVGVDAPQCKPYLYGPTNILSSLL